MHITEERLGLSDRGLATLCARYGMPVPPRGWWAKKQHRRVFHRKALLPVEPRPKSSSTQATSRRSVRVTARSRAGEAPSVASCVPDDLLISHPLIRKAVAAIRQAALSAPKHGVAMAGSMSGEAREAGKGTSAPLRAATRTGSSSSRFLACGWRQVGNDVNRHSRQERNPQTDKEIARARGRDYTPRGLGSYGAESVERGYQPLRGALFRQRRRMANPRERQVSHDQGLKLAGRQGFEFGATRFCKWLMALNFR